MTAITAGQLSNYVKGKLAEMGEVSITTAAQHNAFIQDKLIVVKDKCIRVWGELLGVSIFDAWMFLMSACNTHPMLSDGRISSYHNTAHVTTMLHRYFDMTRDKTTGLDTATVQEYGQGILAIMFHDVFHSHGQVNDVQNVAKAIGEFSGFYQLGSAVDTTARKLGIEHDCYIPACAFLSDIMGMEPLSQMEPAPLKSLIEQHFGDLRTTKYFDAICVAIQYTQYPHLEGDVFNTLPKIMRPIRVLDLSASASDDWYQQVYEGLFIEACYSDAAEDFVKFCEQQEQFVLRLDASNPYRAMMVERAAMVRLIARVSLKQLESQGMSNGTVSAEG